MCHMRSLKNARGRVSPRGQFPAIQLLNRASRMPFGIFFVVLIRAIVFPYALKIQCLHEDGKTAKCPGSCVRQMLEGKPAIA